MNVRPHRQRQNASSRVELRGASLALLLLLPWRLLAAETDAGLRRVTFLPHWIPQAQFAGCYLAVERGFYRQQGLDVGVLEGGPRRHVESLLASGEATFASHFLSAGLKLRDKGVPLVHLAQITQRSALMLVAHKARGIESLADLEGRKVSLWPDFTVQPMALFRKHRLNVQTITQGPTISLFMRGGVDAASAMWYNEYHLFLDSGLNEDEVTVFFFEQHGLNFPEDAVFCLAETWKSQPDVCRRFVVATLDGWRYVLAHREEALAVVMRHTEKARTGTNRSHQRWMLDRMCDLIQPGSSEVALGELSREAYAAVVSELEQCSQLRTPPAFDVFHVPAHP